MTTMSEHRYAHQIDPNGGSAAARLARMIAPGLRVLELGTGPGTVTRILHGKDCKVTGVEIDPEAIALCRPFCERIIQGDLTSMTWLKALKGEQFDAIVIADVLEHLPNPQVLLEQLPDLLDPKGFLVISLPNASHLSILACLLNGVFPYQTKGLLDNTHLRFFGRKDVDNLLNASGFMWQRWESVELPPEQSELNAYWLALGDTDRAFLQQRTVDGMVYQHVVKAYPSSESGQLEKMRADLVAIQVAMREMEKLHIEQLQVKQECIAALEVQHLQHEQLLKQKYIPVPELQQQHQAELLKQELVTSQEVRDLQQEVQHLQQEQQLKQARISALEVQLQQHQKQFEDAETQIKSILNSHSWRITSPLRWLNREAYKQSGA
jgi:2-polyprenyl-3-methyl-5-hydroxy-6-metoxy-1,4-benzoquinol methylase